MAKGKKVEVVVPPRNYFHKLDWFNVEDFDTIEEALAFAQKHFGADEQGRVSLIREKEPNE